MSAALPPAVQAKASTADQLIAAEAARMAGQAVATPDATVPHGTSEPAPASSIPNPAPGAATEAAAPLSPGQQPPASPDAVQPPTLAGGGVETGTPPIQLPSNIGINLTSATRDQMAQFIGQQVERFRALEGKYQSEVPRLINMNKSLRDDVAARDARIQQLEQTGATPTGDAPNGPDPQWADRFRRDDPTYRDLAEFDPDKAEEHLQRTAAAQIPETPSSEIPQQPQTPAPAQADPGDLRSATQLVQELRGHLDIFLGPGFFDAMQHDTAFDSWLEQVDPMFGGSRKENMHRLVHERNFIAAGDYWKQWALQTGFSPAAQTVDDREQLVEPSPSANGDAPAVDPRDGYLTAEDYEAHSRRWSSDSHYRNSDAGKANREKFDAAIAQGKLGY